MQRKDLYLAMESEKGKDAVSSDLERLTLLEEVSWRQKARAFWLREGDKYTNFFSTVWLI